MTALRILTALTLAAAAWLAAALGVIVWLDKQLTEGEL